MGLAFGYPKREDDYEMRRREGLQSLGFHLTGIDLERERVKGGAWKWAFLGLGLVHKHKSERGIIYKELGSSISQGSSCF